MEQQPTYQQLLNENMELRWQLEEANDAIDAIRNGQVDALIVKNGDGPQLYTLKSADQTYRVFVEQMNEGAVTLNREGLILYSNSRFAALVGKPLEQVMGFSFVDFVADDKSVFLHMLNSSWEKDCKAEITIANGVSDIPCLMSCNAMDFDGGKALSVIITDLTIQKENQKQLEMQFGQLEEAQLLTQKLNDELEETVKIRTKDLTISREYLKLLMDNIPQMTWTNLPNGQITFYNKRWYIYTGKTPPTTGIYESFRDFIHPDDLKLTEQHYYGAMQSGNVYEFENRYRKADGTYRWHLNRGVPLLDEDGEILFWVGSATDIEEQKQAMDKKDEFIGIASHELKTPLTSLKGYIQLMGMYKKEEVPTAIKQYIGKALNAVSKLQHLINDLLDVSKIQAGRLEYKMADINLADMVKAGVESAIEMYPDYIIESNVEQELPAYGNAERLEQVLNNLVSNAAKYSRSGSKITIEGKVLDGNVHVLVTDEGIGLSDEQREKIFERFYRVEDKTYSASGLGMGLYISTEIIKHHKGQINVRSEIGKGSTFYFTLPVSKGNHQD